MMTGGFGGDGTSPPIFLAFFSLPPRPVPAVSTYLQIMLVRVPEIALGDFHRGDGIGAAIPAAIQCESGAPFIETAHLEMVPAAREVPRRDRLGDVRVHGLVIGFVESREVLCLLPVVAARGRAGRAAGPPA